MFCGVIVLRYMAVAWTIKMLPMLILMGCATSFLANLGDALIRYFSLTIDIPFEDDDGEENA